MCRSMEAKPDFLVCKNATFFIQVRFPIITSTALHGIFCHQKLLNGDLHVR